MFCLRLVLKWPFVPWHSRAEGKDLFTQIEPTEPESICRYSEWQLRQRAIPYCKYLIWHMVCYEADTGRPFYSPKTENRGHMGKRAFCFTNPGPIYWAVVVSDEGIKQESVCMSWHQMSSNFSHGNNYYCQRFELAQPGEMSCTGWQFFLTWTFSTLVIQPGFFNPVPWHLRDFIPGGGGEIV